MAISKLAVKRMKLEVVWHGGLVSGDLSSATHLVAYSLSGQNLFWKIHNCCSLAERPLLLQLHVVSHHWLEESLASRERLSEETYTLRPHTVDLDAFKYDVKDKRDRKKVLGPRKRKGGAGSAAKPGGRTRARITEEEGEFASGWTGSTATEEKKKVSYKEAAAELLGDQ